MSFLNFRTNLVRPAYSVRVLQVSKSCQSCQHFQCIQSCQSCQPCHFSPAWTTGTGSHSSYSNPVSHGSPDMSVLPVLLHQAVLQLFQPCQSCESCEPDNHVSILSPVRPVSRSNLVNPVSHVPVQ
jgi:hypothetical protein